MDKLHHVAVAGATGRMGRMLIEAVFRSSDMILQSALDRPGHEAIGQDVGDLIGEKLNAPIQPDIPEALQGADFLIDFTQPEATLAHLKTCVTNHIGIVIGTTGFSESQKAEIREASTHIPVVFAPNMSVGVNVMFRLLRMAAESLGSDYDVEIIEAHHRHKKDAPSGTALKMGEIIASALDRDVDKCAVFGRHGMTGERDQKTIGFSAVRGGDIVGDHTVLFAGVGERLEIIHRSSSRATYAEGSLRAVRFLAGKQNGLFDMQDVLFGSVA